ncbi:hypothetical protein D3C76_929070 [compost metagenome]
MVNGFQGRNALVGLVAYVVGVQVSHVPHVAVTSLQIQRVVDLVGHTGTGQRGYLGIAGAHTVGVAPVGASFTEQGEVVAQRQTSDTGQGGTLALVTVAIGVATAGVLVAQLGTEVFVEVVTDEGIGSSRVFFTSVHAFDLVQTVEVSCTDTGTEVDIISGVCSSCTHGSHGDGDQGRSHFHHKINPR